MKIFRAIVSILIIILLIVIYSISMTLIKDEDFIGSYYSVNINKDIKLEICGKAAGIIDKETDETIISDLDSLVVVDDALYGFCKNKYFLLTISSKEVTYSTIPLSQYSANTLLSPMEYYREKTMYIDIIGLVVLCGCIIITIRKGLFHNLRSNRLGWLAPRRIVTLILLLVLCIEIQGQTSTQADLLNKAYSKHSKSLLYSFFDNWSDEISSNENESPNKWVAEAHKVFAAFYQPLELEKIGCRNEDKDLYKNSRYFIIQDTLQNIYMADSIPFAPDELESYYISRIEQKYPNDSIRMGYIKMVEREKHNRELAPVFDIDYSAFSSIGIPTTEVVSNISFRPPVQFTDRKIVYLTSKYKRLLDNFLGNEHIDLGTESVMQVARSKGSSRKRMEFINNACKIFYGHWGGYWQYETYPIATSIVFDSKMQRAVVYYRLVYEGGVVMLEKLNGRWTILSGRLTWIE